MADGSSCSDAASSSGSSDPTSGDDGAPEAARGQVDISIQRLQSMHAVASSKEKTTSKYSLNGRSKSRIRNALANPKCNCQCSVPFHAVLQVCIAFWLLTKRGQDTVLWSRQRENPGSGCKRDWYIEGPGVQGLDSLLLPSNMSQRNMNE